MAPRRTAASPTRAVIYTRVSTDRQASEGISLAAQENACSTHAARLGLEVVGAYQDAGFSGRLGHEDRPGLAAVIEACRVDPSVAVIVYSLSRLGRSQRHVAELLDDTGSYRLRLVSVTEPIDMTSAMGRAVAGVIMAFAQLESDLASERISAALAFARSRGTRLGAKRMDERAGGTEILARVRAVAAQHPGAGPRAIASRLNEAGIPSVTGKRWHTVTVRRALALECAPLT